VQICNYNKLEYVVSIASIIALLSSIIFPSAKADNNDNNMSKMGKGGQTIVSSPQGQAIGQPGSRKPTLFVQIQEVFYTSLENAILY
jgi:hypothetical protein